MKKEIKLLLVVLFGISFLLNTYMAEAGSVNLTIRDGADILFSGDISIPTSVTTLEDVDGDDHIIDPSSVLAVTREADIADAGFNISQITYFSSFDSLYLRCLMGSGGEKCDNWQYAVNVSYPILGMDKNVLNDGDSVYVYFGPQNRVSLSESVLSAASTLTVRAEKYDYENDVWLPRSGVTVGLTQVDPANPFSPIEVATNVVNASGEAVFSSIASGSYDVGVKEDFYFPTERLTVSSASFVTGGIEEKIHKALDVKEAVKFLLSFQNSNGSFGEALYTDWAAIGLAKVEGIDLSPLKTFILSNDLPAGLPITEYERRAMALEALGIDPSKGTKIDYIQKIIDGFDGKQFGEKDLYNDDIFAVIPLMHVGYLETDPEIEGAVMFILSKQGIDGSWGGVDLTAAAVQALSLTPNLSSVPDALSKARTFLKNSQKGGGGFGSNMGTSWVIGAIRALGETPESWDVDDFNPNDALFFSQSTDGGVEYFPTALSTRIWATSYAIPAGLGLSWNSILGDFKKSEVVYAKSSAELPIVPTAKVPTKIGKSTLVPAGGDPLLKIERNSVLANVNFSLDMRSFFTGTLTALFVVAFSTLLFWSRIFFKKH